MFLCVRNCSLLREKFQRLYYFMDMCFSIVFGGEREMLFKKKKREKIRYLEGGTVLKCKTKENEKDFQ